MLKDALALAAAAAWAAVNITLWIVVQSQIELFAYSAALAVVFIAGFFWYLSRRERVGRKVTNG